MFLISAPGVEMEKFWPVTYSVENIVSWILWPVSLGKIPDSLRLTNPFGMSNKPLCCYDGWSVGQRGGSSLIVGSRCTGSVQAFLSSPSVHFHMRKSNMSTFG